MKGCFRADLKPVKHSLEVGKYKLFSMGMMKYHHPDNILKKEFIWVYCSRVHDGFYC